MVLSVLTTAPQMHWLSLTHWGRVTHICVSKLSIIGSDNGLSHGRREAIIWSNAGILSIGTLGTKFREILIEILTFSFKNMRFKVPSGKWRPFCFGFNVLRYGLQHKCARLCMAISNYVSLWGTRTPTCLITCKFKEAGYIHIWKFTPM